MAHVKRLVFLPLLLCCRVMAGPATQPVGKLPHIEVDVNAKQIHVECKAVKADYPLEFLAVMTNTNEYEAIVRTEARPSDLHLALLMLGLKPGEPIHYSETEKAWLPPTGPLIKIRFAYDLDGKHFDVPACQWMRDVNTKKPAEDFVWCFSGARTMPDGTYAADMAGHLVGVINNETSVLDVPALKSRAMEAREWERNPDAMPPTDTPVTMIISPAPPAAPAAPTTQPAP